jgi:hypothetical protein
LGGGMMKNIVMKVCLFFVFIITFGGYSTVAESKPKEMFLVLNSLEECIAIVKVIKIDPLSLKRNRVLHIELEVLNDTACVTIGDKLWFHSPLSIGDINWWDTFKYCETITRTNNEDKERVPPGMLYFDRKEAEQGAVYARETVITNNLLNAEFARLKKAGGSLLLDWDSILAKAKKADK